MKYKIRLENDTSWEECDSNGNMMGINERIKDYLLTHPEYYNKDILSNGFKILNIEIEDSLGERHKKEIEINLTFDIKNCD